MASLLNWAAFAGPIDGFSSDPLNTLHRRLQPASPPKSRLLAEGSVVGFSYMTTVLSQKGQLVLPGVIREQLHLRPGDDFEVLVEDDETITLRRISQPANRGLVKLLQACPSPFEIPARDQDDSTPPLL